MVLCGLVWSCSVASCLVVRCRQCCQLCCGESWACLAVHCTPALYCALLYCSESLCRASANAGQEGATSKPSSTGMLQSMSTRSNSTVDVRFTAWVCVCVYVCVCARARTRVRECVWVGACANACTHAGEKERKQLCNPQLTCALKCTERLRASCASFASFASFPPHTLNPQRAQHRLHPKPQTKP